MHKRFAALGVDVVGVMGTSSAAVTAYLNANPLPFALLPDVDRAVIKRYGVYQLISFDAFNMARPSTFLIDRTGVIRFAYVGSTQFDRPAPEVLLQAVENFLP